MAKAKETQSVIEITRIPKKILEVHIVGTSAFIPHAWSEKAKRMMPQHPDRLDTKKIKEKRNAKEEAEACLYKLDDTRLGYPASGFKAAMVGGCRNFEKPSMTEAKQLFFVFGDGDRDLVEIAYERKELREDMVRNKASRGAGTADLRYRYYIFGWSAALRIQYLPLRISRASIVAIVDAAGLCGIGDWRPSSPESFTGKYGMFHVDDTKEVRDVS